MSGFEGGFFHLLLYFERRRGTGCVGIDRKRAGEIKWSQQADPSSCAFLCFGEAIGIIPH